MPYATRAVCISCLGCHSETAVLSSSQAIDSATLFTGRQQAPQTRFRAPATCLQVRAEVVPVSLEISDDELSFAFGLDNWQPFVEQVSTCPCWGGLCHKKSAPKHEFSYTQLAVHSAGMLSCRCCLASFSGSYCSLQEVRCAYLPTTVARKLTALIVECRRSCSATRSPSQQNLNGSWRGQQLQPSA